MPLLLLDLDNTLIDRTAAFRRWAEDFVHARGAPDREVEWLVDADQDGYAPRETLAALIRTRFQLTGSTVGPLVDDLRCGMVERLRLDPEVPRALRAARSTGWEPVVVTNGTVEQQERKIRRTGLSDWLSGWIISEGAGVKKPDRRIFERAAELAGLPLREAWMIGDAPQADIGGAHGAGLASIWLHRGRKWEERRFSPSIILDDCPAAVDHVAAL